MMKYVALPPPPVGAARKIIISLWRGSRKLFTRKRVAIVGALATVALVAIPIMTYAQYSQDIADRERLMNRKSTGIIIRDKHGEIFYEYGKLNRSEDVKLSEVSDVFETTLITSEDRDFRKHEGYSLRGIASAIEANILNKDPTRFGGSTITQQLVKNKLLSAEKSYLRKYKEIAMAVAIEREYSKDEILEMYINSVYFGEGAFGIADASQTYFNKKPQDLTLTESSILVGLLPAPSLYSPVTGDKEKSKQQQEWVLNKMVETATITQAEKEASLTQQITFHATADTKPKHAQHFAIMVLDELKQKYGEETIIRSGFDVTTTLDLTWQKQAEHNVRERVQALGHAGARNAGLVAADPKNGQIRALVGSVDWENPTFGKVNMATMARQPGSSFKPIYYTEALNKKLITPATIIKDEPKTYGDTYKPTNYDFKYRGNVSVRDALAQSLNIPSIDVIQKLGVVEASQTAQRMGISTVTEPDKYGLTLALGTAEVKLNEMVGAYAAFANNGNQSESIFITKISDKFDNQVFEWKQLAAKQVTSPEASYLISSILSDNEARAPTFGNNLTIPNRKVAVKTGTTNDSKDAWTIGYTPSVVVGVWMGNNENEPMIGLAGSSSAGGVWRNSMANFLENTPVEEFKKPDSIIALQICKGTDQKAASGASNTREEFFIRGAEPTQECNARKQEAPKEEKRNDEKREEDNERDENRDENRNEKKREEDSAAPQQPVISTPTSPDTTDTGGRGGGEPTQEPKPPPENEETSPTPAPSPNT